MIRVCFKLSSKLNFINDSTECMEIRVREDLNISDKRKNFLSEFFRNKVAERLKCDVSLVEPITLEEYFRLKERNKCSIKK